MFPILKKIIIENRKSEIDTMTMHLRCCSQEFIVPDLKHIILGPKANLKCQWTETTPCILPNHTGIKPEANGKRNHRNYTQTQRLNSTFLINRWKNQKNQFKWLESNENNNTIYHVLGETTKAILREKNPNLWLHCRVIANKETNVAPQSLR